MEIPRPSSLPLLHHLPFLLQLPDRPVPVRGRQPEGVGDIGAGVFDAGLHMVQDGLGDVAAVAGRRLGDKG